MNMPRRAAPASDLEVRIAALELIVEHLVATSMDADPAAWGAFEANFDGGGRTAADDLPWAGVAGDLDAAAANDVLSILRAARRRSDALAQDAGH